MNVSKKLYQTNKLVKSILEEDERARNSDTHLYLQVLYEVGQIKGIDVNAMLVPNFLKKRDELGFPCFETVRRTRQKLQATFPELAACDKVADQRKINERVYRTYAQSKSIKIGDNRNEEDNSNDFSINNVNNGNRLWGELGTN